LDLKAVMSGLTFGRDEVKKHLLSLGYTNVTEEQLNEFCKDLKRLVRYEEKQNRIQAQLQLRKRHREKQQQHRPRSADSTYSSGTDGQSTPRVQTVSHERRELRYDKKSGNVTHESLVTTATLGYDDEDEAEDADPSSCASNASIVQERRKVTYKVPQSRRESSRNKSDDEVVKIRLNLDDEGETLHTTGDSSGGRYTKLKERQPLKERPDFDGGCFDLLNRPSGSTMTKQVLPPRPLIPTKPTTSCIKPSAPSDGGKPSFGNKDPVQLYADYKKHWDKLRLPGDGSDKQLRWAVREWMMGDPPK